MLSSVVPSKKSTWSLRCRWLCFKRILSKGHSVVLRSTLFVSCTLALLMVWRTVLLPGSGGGLNHERSTAFAPSGPVVTIDHDSSISKPAIWLQSASTAADKFFGNGFVQIESRCPSVMCLFNPASEATICRMSDLLVNRGLITVSAGNEEIESVAGRDEADEFPRYSRGALQLHKAAKAEKDTCSDLIIAPTQPLHYRFHMTDMLRSLTVEPFDTQCDISLKGTSLLITRYEYANLYHTMTDWYNAYQTLQMQQPSTEPINIIFMDGHSKGALDSAWRTLFGVDPIFISSLPQKVCFRKAVLVPAGYSSPLSIDLMLAKGAAFTQSRHVADFVNAFLANMNLAVSRPNRPARILLIFRRDYNAHPRIGQRRMTRRIANEEEISQAIRQSLGDVELDVASFEMMSFEDQVAAVRRATVIVGVHGAGLSHVLFADQHTALLELIPRGYSGHAHFRLFAKYAGVTYESLSTPGKSGNGEIHVKVNQLVTLLKRLVGRGKD